MRAARPSLPNFLRTLVLGLLALAIVVKPVLAELCNAHAISHAAATAAAAAAKHVDSAAEERSDRDHASGKHQVLHAADATPGYIEHFAALTVPPSRFAEAAPPALDDEPPPARGFDSPFRPPIA
jgi:hypothetical protein